MSLSFASTGEVLTSGDYCLPVDATVSAHAAISLPRYRQDLDTPKADITYWICIQLCAFVVLTGYPFMHTVSRIESCRWPGWPHLLTPPYERRRPEQTLLYQLVDTHYPVFRAQLEAQGQTCLAISSGVRISSMRSEHGLRVRCEGCKHERLVAFSCKGGLLPQLRAPTHGRKCSITRR